MGNCLVLRHIIQIYQLVYLLNIEDKSHLSSYKLYTFPKIITLQSFVRFMLFNKDLFGDKFSNAE